MSPFSPSAKKLLQNPCTREGGMMDWTAAASFSDAMEASLGERVCCLLPDLFGVLTVELRTGRHDDDDDDALLWWK